MFCFAIYFVYNQFYVQIMLMIPVQFSQKFYNLFIFTRTKK